MGHTIPLDEEPTFELYLSEEYGYHEGSPFWEADPEGNPDSADVERKTLYHLAGTLRDFIADPRIEVRYAHSHRWGPLRIGLSEA